jgi:hypothetical protein
VTELGRVTDPRALDAATGSCGRVRVVIPEGWARAGAAIEVVLPPRVECGVCRGGGCDRCGRSGAHRLPAQESERTLALSLPPLECGAVLLRVPNPFGSTADLELLTVEVATGEEASSCCRLMAAEAPEAQPLAANAGPTAMASWAWLLLLVSILVVAALSFMAR